MKENKNERMYKNIIIIALVFISGINAACTTLTNGTTCGVGGELCTTYGI